jgi:hypothetical protein
MAVAGAREPGGREGVPTTSGNGCDADIGVSKALATDDRVRLVDRASANWGV